MSLNTDSEAAAAILVGEEEASALAMQQQQQQQDTTLSISTYLAGAKFGEAVGCLVGMS